MQKLKPLLWIDLLGFSDHVEKHSLDELIQHYHTIISMHFDSYSKVELTILSDTLIFTPKGINSQITDLKHVILAAQLYSSSSFIDFPFLIPHLTRGSIVMDEYYLGQANFFRKSVYSTKDGLRNENLNIPYFGVLGKAVVKAAKLEQIQNWCLVSIHPELIQFIETNLIELVEKNILIKYEIPLKNDKTIESYVVNPFNGYIVKGEMLKFEINEGVKTITGVEKVPNRYFNTLEKYRKSEDIGIKSKIENTIKFYEYVVLNNLLVKTPFCKD